MIENVSSTNPGFFLNVIRIQNLQDGRITVPVHPAHVVYARFKHIQGVPAQDGGAPLFRLRVLDNLIDRLLRYREQVPTAEQLRNLHTEAVDPLISRLQNRLRSHLLQFPSSFGGSFPETGMLIDMSA
ncbi:MAG: hypothetical protein JSV89_15960 [Spirochaetaceae bacterium]|nr:MAG: hypothetical protein JSV89_15960 [Spirochaetaceae bacterium]